MSDAPSMAALYVLSAGYDGLYKVGRTSVPLSRRISQLNTGAARKLTPVASFAVSQAHACKCEAFMHAALRDLSACEAGGKEFFRCDDEKEFAKRVGEAWNEFSSFAQDLLETQESAEKVLDLFNARRTLSAEVKQLEVKKSMIEDALVSKFVDGFSRGATPLLSWQKRSAERFDLEAFRKDHPEMAAQYTRTRTTRSPVFL